MVKAYDISTMDADDRLVFDYAKSALAQGFVLSFDYDGHPRIAEVHTIGVTNTGKPAMRAFQVLGGSKSGSPNGFRLFALDKCENIRILATRSLAPREEYKKDDQAFFYILGEI